MGTAGAGRVPTGGDARPRVPYGPARPAGPGERRERVPPPRPPCPGHAAAPPARSGTGDRGRRRPGRRRHIPGDLSEHGIGAPGTPARSARRPCPMRQSDPAPSPRGPARRRRTPATPVPARPARAGDVTRHRPPAGRRPRHRPNPFASRVIDGGPGARGPRRPGGRHAPRAAVPHDPPPARRDVTATVRKARGRRGSLRLFPSRHVRARRRGGHRFPPDGVSDRPSAGDRPGADPGPPGEPRPQGIRETTDARRACANSYRPRRDRGSPG